MISKVKSILHIVADDNESSRFLLLYHRLFNIITLKQLYYVVLLMIVLKYQ